MYGRNHVANFRPAREGYLVHSIFYTIQGEGPWAGWPAIFIRFAGCNLRCSWCDTEFEQNAAVLSLAALLDHIIVLSEDCRCTRLVLTGGEPLLQGIYLLLLSLPLRFQVQIETAGTVWGPDESGAKLGYALLRLDAWIVCSPKTPKVHRAVIHHTNAWKYILRAGQIDENDGLPTGSTQFEGCTDGKSVYRPHPNNSVPIYVHPCDDGDAVRNAHNLRAAADSALKYGYRLGVQMHKLVGLP